MHNILKFSKINLVLYFLLYKHASETKSLKIRQEQIFTEIHT